MYKFDYSFNHLMTYKEINRFNEGIKNFEFLDKEELEVIGTLNLHRNSIASLNGIPFMRELKELNLSSNQLESSAFHELLCLINLENLDVSGNDIKTLKTLSFLPNLVRFSIAFNYLTSLEGIQNFANLEHLDVRGNYLRDLKSVSELQALSQLKSLEISSNPISKSAQTILSLFSLCPKLLVIDNHEISYWRASALMPADITPKFDKIASKFGKKLHKKESLISGNYKEKEVSTHRLMQGRYIGDIKTEMRPKEVHEKHKIRTSRKLLQTLKIISISASPASSNEKLNNHNEIVPLLCEPEMLPTSVNLKYQNTDHDVEPVGHLPSLSNTTSTNQHSSSIDNNLLVIENSVESAKLINNVKGISILTQLIKNKHNQLKYQTFHHIQQVILHEKYQLEILQYRQKLGVLQIEITQSQKQLQQQRETHSSEKLILEKQRAFDRRKVDSLRLQIDQLQSNYQQESKSASATIRLIQSRLEESEQQRQDLTEKLSQVNTNLIASISQRDDLQLTLSTSTAQRKEIQRGLEEETSSLRASLAKCQSDLVTMSTTIVELTTRLATTESEAANSRMKYETDMSLAAQQLTSIEKEKTDIFSKLQKYEQEINSLHNQIEVEKESRNSAERKLLQVHHAFESLSSDMDSMRLELDRSHSKDIQKKKTISELCSMVQELKQSNNLLKQKLSSSTEQISYFQSQISSTQSDSANTLRSLQDQLQQLQQLQLQGEKQQHSDRTRAEVALKQAEEMINRISSLENELTTTTTALKIKNKIIDDLNIAYAEMKAKLAAKQSELQEHRQGEKELSDQLEYARSEITELNIQLASHSKIDKHMRRMMKELTSVSVSASLSSSTSSSLSDDSQENEE